MEEDPTWGGAFHTKNWHIGVNIKGSVSVYPVLAGSFLRFCSWRQTGYQVSVFPRCNVSFPPPAITLTV